MCLKRRCLHDFHAFIETRPAHPSYLEPTHYGAVTVDTLLWHPPSGQIEAEEGEQLEGLEPKFAVSPWGPDTNWKVQYCNCSKASASCLTGCWVSTLNSQSELLEVQQYGYEVQATTPLGSISHSFVVVVLLLVLLVVFLIPLLFFLFFLTFYATIHLSSPTQRPRP
ncbi:hypothetical protein QOT17_014771 [Balamuthia mandrillaris]